MGKKAVKTGRMGQVAVGENFRTGKKNKKGEEESLARDKIMAFDREWVKIDEDSKLAAKIVYVILGALGCLMMFFPVGSSIYQGSPIFFLFTWMFLYVAVIFKMQPYIYAPGEGKRIISLLAYVPVDKKMMCCIRREILRRYLFKIGAVCFGFQQAGALLWGEWSVVNLLYPFGVVLSLYLFGALHIGSGA